MRRVFTSLYAHTLPVLLLLSSSALSLARTPDNLADAQREARIVADVVKSALRNEAGDSIRVTSVVPQFLAEQGVLLTVNINTPWLGGRGQNNNSQYQNGPQGPWGIPEIPAMVQNILDDLQINMGPYEPDALEEVRELRDEQRELRQEQRKLRAELRKDRREMTRKDDPEDKAELAEEIAQQEVELAELDTQYDELSRAIDQQYQRLRNFQHGYNRDDDAPAPDLDGLIAQTACDYGGTLKSLDDNQYLTIALHRGDAVQFYTFRMDNIQRCSDQRMAPGDLLESAYLYDG